MTRLLCIADFHFGARKCPGLGWLAAQIKLAQPDIVIIAGDIFDKKALPDDSAVISNFLERLGIPVVLIWGNHDAACGAPIWFPMPKNVHFPTFEGITVPGFDLVFHGCDVIEKRDNRSVADLFPVATGPGHIGVFHTSVTGKWSKNPCLPCTPQQLLRCDYDAWILGHVHEPISLFTQPPIFWPGLRGSRVLVL